MDTAELVRWCEEHGDFTSETRQAVANYFESDPTPQVRSLLSVPIGPSDDDPIGVLNIHRSTPGLLKETESALQQFVPLLHPIIIMLRRLLERLPS